MTFLAGSRDGVEAPEFVSGRWIERGDEPSDPELAASRTGDDLVLDYQWRQRERVTGLRSCAGNGDVPALT